MKAKLIPARILALPVFALALCAGVLALCANTAHGASPALDQIDPPGGQRGTDVDVTLNGDRLDDAKGLLFYTPGIEVTDFKAVNGKKITAKLRLAPDCPLGRHEFRVWTASGVSEMRVFFAGPYPDVKDAGNNNDLAHAQKIGMNVTVTGVIKGEESDYYVVEAKKGQRLTAEVEGIRLGITMFDPWMAILDKNGKTLASCDDSALLLQDPLISLITPADGTYYIQVRDSDYTGSDRCKYRLHVGNFPQPLVAYPPGGPEKQELTLRLLGDPFGAITQKVPPVTLENGLSKTGGVYAQQDNLIAPAANQYRVSPFPNVLEVEPNNDVAHATATTLPLPLAFNGVISEKGDIDFFRFKAKKDEVYDFRVYARALRSPLDSVLAIYDAKGKQLASNDDSGGPDSYLQFKIPADGEYCLSVTDQIKNGGLDYVYRVEVTPAQSEFVLSMTQPVKDSQERQTISVPRGNRFGAVLHAKRTDFNGDITVASPDLPPGVTMEVAPMPGNSDTIPVIFEAKDDAAVDGKLCAFTTTPADATKKVITSFEHAVDLIISNPNQTVYYSTKVDKLPVSVADEAPFKVRIIPPKSPLVQNGSVNLKVAIDRKEGFKGAVEVALLYKPNGIGADNTVKIPEGQSEGVIQLSINGDAQLHKWKIAVTGMADSGKGQVWVSSPFEDIEVAAPYVTAKLDRGFVEQGQSGTVLCKLTQNRPFEGKAKLQLVNLPGKVTAQDVEITSADQEVQIPVAADKTSSVTQKKDLFCMITITTPEGEQVTQSAAQGGILRVGKAGAPK